MHQYYPSWHNQLLELHQAAALLPHLLTKMPLHQKIYHLLRALLLVLHQPHPQYVPSMLHQDLAP